MLCLTIYLLRLHSVASRAAVLALTARGALVGAGRRAMNEFSWPLVSQPATYSGAPYLQPQIDCAAVNWSLLQSLTASLPHLNAAKILTKPVLEAPSGVAMMASRGTKRQPDCVGPGPQDQKRAKSDEVDRVTGSGQQLVPPNNCDYKKLTLRMSKYYERTHQTTMTFAKKMRLRDALYAVMKGVFPYCGLYVVGSSLNSFGTDNSDMDLCLMLCHNQIDQKKEATEILQILCKALRKCTFLKQVIVIRAKVPILKFTDSVSGVECDLNVNNAVGIRNTHLMNAYANLEPRVCELALFLKHWGKVQNINDAKTGTISSYSLVLMLIHYLQCGVNPPVLPSLQQMYPTTFNRDMDIRLLSLNESLPPYTSHNTQPIGELLVGFLYYYAHLFDYEKSGISIRLCRTMPRETIVNQDVVRNPPSQWKCLCIEEPFDLSNTARSVYDHYTFMRIVRVFRQSYHTLQLTGEVEDILKRPL